MNILVRVALGIVIAVVALFACLYLTINSLDNDRARKWLFPVVAKYAGYRVEVPGSIDTRLNRFLELELSKGSVKPIEKDTAETAQELARGETALMLNADWDHVLVRLDPLELLFWQIGFEKIIVDNFQARALPQKEKKEVAVASEDADRDTKKETKKDENAEQFNLPINIAVHGIDMSKATFFLTNEEGTTEIIIDHLLGSMRLTDDDIPVLSSELKLASLRLKAPLTLKEGPVEETIEEVSNAEIPDAETERNSVIKDFYALLEQPPMRFDQVKVAVESINAGEWKTHSVQSSLKWNKSRFEASLALGEPVSKVMVEVDIPGRIVDLKGDLRHFAIGPVINSVVTFGFLPRSIKKDILTGDLRAFADIVTNGATTDSFLQNLNGKLYVIVEDGSVDATIVEAFGFDIAETAVSLLSGNPNTEVNCIVADIDVKSGVVNGDNVIVETDDSKIRGSGNVNLVQSTIDYRLAVEAGDTSPLSVPAPIFIKGPFSEPKFSVEEKTLIKEILSAVIQPAEALIEWARGKDKENPKKSEKRCEALLAH